MLQKNLFSVGHHLVPLVKRMDLDVATNTEADDRCSPSGKSFFFIVTSSFDLNQPSHLKYTLCVSTYIYMARVPFIQQLINF